MTLPQAKKCPRNAVARGLLQLFCNTPGHWYLADIQHFWRLVVEEALFAVAAAVEEVFESFAGGVHHVGRQALIFGDVRGLPHGQWVCKP